MKKLVFVLLSALAALLVDARPASAMFSNFGPFAAAPNPAALRLGRVAGTGTNYIDSTISVSTSYVLWAPTNVPTGYYTSYLYFNCTTNEDTFSSSYAANSMNYATCPNGELLRAAWVVVVAY